MTANTTTAASAELRGIPVQGSSVLVADAQRAQDGVRSFPPTGTTGDSFDAASA